MNNSVPYEQPSLLADFLGYLGGLFSRVEPPARKTLGEWVTDNGLDIPYSAGLALRIDEVLDAQLGERWKTFGQAKPYVQVAMLQAAMLADDIEKHSFELRLFQKALAEQPSRLKDCVLDRFLRRMGEDYKLVDMIRNIGKGHAFTSTTMIAMVEHAKTKSVFMVPGTFSWIEAYDPSLWAALESGWIKSERPEGIAAVRHYAHEKKVGEALLLADFSWAIPVFRTATS